MKTWLVAGAFALAVVVGGAQAQEQEQDKAQDETAAFLQSLKYSAGKVAIPEAHATLDIAPGFHYLGHDDTRRVLEQLWGNPPNEDVIGMIVPDEATVADEHGWAVLVTYSDDGYVSDEDAAKIDYDELLGQMKESTDAESQERVKQGYEGIKLIGWARPPTYDAASKRLHWAKEIAFAKTDGHTLNYDIRVLGREGYLNLNAIAQMTELDHVSAGMEKVLPMAQFDAGHRYADYKHGDRTAAYGLAALVAGGVLAKTGLLAKIGVMLLAAKKLILVGLVAIGGFFKKLFGGKDKHKNNTVQ